MSTDLSFHDNNNNNKEFELCLEGNYFKVVAANTVCTNLESRDNSDIT